MIKFKLCPRCRGDLYLGEDIFGAYYSCLQCGYLRDVEKPKPASDLVADTERREGRLAA